MAFDTSKRADTPQPSAIDTASRYDGAPILGVGPELVPLERIDLIADETGEGHLGPPTVDVSQSELGVPRDSSFVRERNMKYWRLP